MGIKIKTAKTLAAAIVHINSNFEGMDIYFETPWTEDSFAAFCHSQRSGGIGMKIRNYFFKFWSDKKSPLYLDLKKNHGCKDPDAMSDKIIRGVFKLRTIKDGTK